MGIYRPLVETTQSANRVEIDHGNDRSFTIPDVMTYARPLLALNAAYRLATGSDKKVTGLVGSTAASDAEGNVGRFIDKFLPRTRLGTSDHGKRNDPVADSIAVAEIAVGTWLAPRVTRLGKLAVGIVLAQELTKTVWAIDADRKYRKAYPGKKLELSANKTGKESMVEKFFAIGAASATHDIKKPLARAGLSLFAVGHAVAGAIHGERARRAYVPIIENLMSSAPAGQPDIHPMANIVGDETHWSVVSRATTAAADEGYSTILSNATRRGLPPIPSPKHA